MVIARGIAAYPESADEISVPVVQCEASAKYVDPSDTMTDQRIVAFAKMRCRTPVDNGTVHWVAELQPEQAAAGLNQAIQIARSERPAHLRCIGIGALEAKQIGRVGLLGRYHAAAGPLITFPRPGTRDRAHASVATYHGRPHVVSESGLDACQAGSDGGNSGFHFCCQLTVAWQDGAPLRIGSPVLISGDRQAAAGDEYYA